MAERTLESRYRLLAAGFRDSDRAAAWKDRLGADGFGEALDLIVFVLAHDLALPPRELDREHLSTLLATLLPGRLAGSEPYRAGIADLLEDLLLFIATEEGLSTAWEWSSALGDARKTFERTLKDPDRPVPATAPRRDPDRRPAPKIGRNEPCPCGSGKKYKHCCARLL